MPPGANAFTPVILVLQIDRQTDIFSIRNGIEDSLSSTKIQLDKLQAEITKTLEKIASREKYMNSQLEPQLNEYRRLSQALAQTKEQYKKVIIFCIKHEENRI